MSSWSTIVRVAPDSTSTAARKLADVGRSSARSKPSLENAISDPSGDQTG